MSLRTDDDMSLRSPAFHDRRQFGRRATFKRAIMLGSDGAETPCIVVDLSDGGARITVRDGLAAEQYFDLRIPEDDFIVACEVVHRTEGSLGARFSRAPRKLSWLKRPRAQRSSVDGAPEGS